MSETQTDRILAAVKEFEKSMWNTRAGADAPPLNIKEFVAKSVDVYRREYERHQEADKISGPIAPNYGPAEGAMDATIHIVSRDAMKNHGLRPNDLAAMVKSSINAYAEQVGKGKDREAALENAYRKISTRYDAQGNDLDKAAALKMENQRNRGSYMAR